MRLPHRCKTSATWRLYSREQELMVMRLSAASSISGSCRAPNSKIGFSTPALRMESASSMVATAYQSTSSSLYFAHTGVPWP